jgi:hypothetical protein
MPDQTSGLTPTSEDMAWYKRATDKPGIWLDDLFDNNLPLGKRPIDALEKAGEVIGQTVASSATLRTAVGAISSADRGLKQYAKEKLDAAGPYDINMDPLVAAGSLLSLVEDSSNFLREGATAFAEDRAIPAIEQLTGKEVDPRAAGLYGEAVGSIPGELAAAGLGKGVKVLKNVDLPPPSNLQPAFAGNVSNFPSPGGIDLQSLGVNPITTEPRLRAPGMVEGVAQKYRGDLDARAAKLAEVAERQAAAVSTSAKRRTKVQEVRARSTGPSIKGDDPVAYGRRRYLADDPLDPGTKMEQHHLFTKAQSAPFIKKMDELIAKGIADEDDLVNMFAWAEKLDATMGDRLSNLLNSPRIAHVGEATSIHPELRRAGLEIRPKLIEGMVSEAKNATELMDLFNNFIITNVKPSQKLAKEITESYLANKKSFTKVEQTAMEDFLAQLRQRGS